MKANNKIRYIPKVFITLLLLLFISTTLHAQNPIAQLKFEDAEKAFNEGNYEKALHYVKETEALAGVTSKTLYMKIVSQDKLVAGGQSNILGALKSNVQKYLTALKDQDIDDKYRMVYEISKKLDDYATQGIASTQTGIGLAPSDKEVARILNAYRKAVTGSASPASVHSIIVETELIRNGRPFGSMTEAKSVGKYSMEMKMGIITTKIVYNNGKGYLTMAGRQMPLTQIEKYKQLTSPGNLIPRIINPNDYANATVEKGVYNGERVDAIRSPGKILYFDSDTHLLIAQKWIKADQYSSTTTFGDYMSFQGIKFPSTITEVTVTPTAQEIPNTSALNKTDKQEPRPAYNTVAIGLIGKKKRKRKRGSEGLAAGLIGKSPKKNANHQPSAKMEEATQKLIKSFQSTGSGNGNTTTTLIRKIKSVKINEPIPDEIFK